MNDFIFENTNIKVNVTDNDVKRRERLAFVIGYLFASDNSVIKKIVKIEDEKGFLILHWNTEPTEENVKNCSNVWKSILCCENTGNITHYLNSKPI